MSVKHIIWRIKAEIGLRAEHKKQAYYKQWRTYRGLPRYLEILSNWPNWPLKRRWVIRDRKGGE